MALTIKWKASVLITIVYPLQEFIQGKCLQLDKSKNKIRILKRNKTKELKMLKDKINCKHQLLQLKSKRNLKQIF